MGGYKGDTLPIRFDQGGFFPTPNRDSVNPQLMMLESLNINLNDGGRRKRGGTTPVNSTAISGNPQIMGMFDFIQRDGSQFLIIGTKDGKVYKDFTNTIKTGLSTSNYQSFTAFNDVLYSVDGAATMNKWTGSGNMANIGTPATDWATDSQFPRQLVVHGKGVSERLWTYTGKGKVFASALNNGDVMSSFQSIPKTRGGEDITAIWEYADQFLVFSANSTLILTDSSATTSTWGWTRSQVSAGVAHWRLLADIRTDLLAMMDDGDIYSVITVQAKGDYKDASVSKPHFIDRYIRDNIDLTKIESFHMHFDPIYRALLVYMVKNGSTVADVCLPYFKDLNAWGPPHENVDFNSGFKASSAVYVKVAKGDYRIRTGDHQGQVWDLHRNALSDDGNVYRAGIDMPEIDTGDPRKDKKFHSLTLHGYSFGNDTVSLGWAVDGAIQNPDIQVASVVALGVKFDSAAAVFDEFIFGGDGLTEVSFQLGVVGKRITFFLYNDTVLEDLFITSALLDFEYLSKKPAT